MNRLIVLLTLIFLVGCGQQEEAIETPEATVEVNEIKRVSGKIADEESVQAKYESLGMFKLTAYCPCNACSGKWGTLTATGIHAIQGVTVAVDPSIIPYNTVLLINGTEYTAQDCGGGVKGNHIDIYFEDHEEAKRFGVQYAEVFIEVERYE